MKKLFLFFFVLTISVGILAQTTVGPNDAVSGANVTGIGTIAWTNPENALSDDASYATIFLTNDEETSNYLQTTNYGFAIPNDASITGIQVTINRFQNSTTGTSINDAVVQLIKGGSIVGDNKASGTEWSTSTSSTASYGSTSDLWGTTWTPAEINASDFGVSLAATTGTNSDRTGSVDYMTISITYTPAPITYTWNQTGSASWATAANWTPTRTTPAANDILVFDNGATTTATSVPSQTIGRLLISGNTSVTLSAGGSTQTLTIGNVTGDDLVVENGSSLTKNSNLENIVLAASSTADISGTYTNNGTYNTNGTSVVTTVTGSIINSGTITNSTASKLLFQSGSTYQHSQNGGTISTATWDANSTLNITGMTSTYPSGMGQTFGNVSFNVNSSSDEEMTSSLICQGNLSLANSDDGSLRLTDGSTNRTISVGGNFTHTTGEFRQSNGSGTGNVNVQGNFIKSGAGEYVLASDVANVSLTVVGNVTISEGTVIMSEDDGNGTLNVGGDFSHTAGTVTETADGVGTIVFNGTSDQTYTGGGTLSNTINFTVNKPSGNVVLNSNLQINGTLTFTSGNLNTDSNTLTFGSSAVISGEGAGKYLIGNLSTTRTVGTDAFNFGGVNIVAGISTVGNVTLTRVSGSAPAGTGSKLNRSWDISITGTQPLSTGRSVTFSWVQDDDGSVDLSQAVLFRSTDGGTTWTPPFGTGGQDVSATRSITAASVTTFSLWTVGDESAPLPVDLTSFTASVKGSSVILNWETKTEVSNYGFEIERAFNNSKPKIQNPKFEKIGFVKGHGNSNSPKEYSFIDNKLNLGTYSYRLKQIDTDGGFEYSKVVEIDFSVTDNFNLEQNYPNPFNPATVINWQLPVESHVNLKVYDILGNEIAILVNEEKPAGIYKTVFDASLFPSGIYFYKLQAGNFIATKKMLFLK